VRLQPSYLQLPVVVVGKGVGSGGLAESRGSGEGAGGPPVIDDLRDTLSSSVDPFFGSCPGLLFGCWLLFLWQGTKNFLF